MLYMCVRVVQAANEKYEALKRRWEGLHAYLQEGIQPKDN